MMPMCLAYQVDEPQPQVIRVGLSDTNFKNWEYKNITIFGTNNCEIYDKASGRLITRIEPNQLMNFEASNGMITLKDLSEVNFSNVVITCPEGLLGIKDLKRKGKQALYHGAIELAVKEGSLTNFYTINLVELEEYLKGVVPNEMPVKFGLEALKAQAVAARNYALAPRTKSYKEFDVVDSVASQVYFGANTEEALATQAVEETNGLVALYNWEPILALYSSTAGGYTESYAYAFSDPKTKEFPSKEKPYLIAKPDMISQMPLNNEEDARSFYKNVKDSYDIKSPYFRWEKEWSRSELEENLVKTLVAQSKTGFVEPKFEAGDKLGKLKELKVKRRGESGKVVELEIVTDSKNYTVYKELVIRRILPKNNISLPSANVVFEHEFDANGDLLKITAYGGGFGHGVGMSQYGAGFMASSLGFEYDKIIRHYYTGVAITTPVVILSAHDKQKVAYQEFYTDKEKATLVVDNKFNIKCFSVKINDYFVELPLQPKSVNRIDVAQYLEHGKNTITYFYPMNEGPKKGLRAYVEVVEKNDGYLF